MQVRARHDIAVDQAQITDPHSRQFESGGAAQTADSHQTDFGISQPQLTFIADVGQHNLPRIGFQVGIGQFVDHIAHLLGIGLGTSLAKSLLQIGQTIFVPFRVFSSFS